MHSTPRNVVRHLGTAAILAGSLYLAPAAYAADATAASTPSNVAFVGGDVTEDSWYPYIGLIHHFSGSLTNDGWLFQAFGFYSPYEYTTNAVPGGKVNGDAAAFDVMIGYQKVLSQFTLRGYTGPEFENDELSPNNTFDHTRGSDAGVKVQGEIETNYDTPFYGDLIGNYGTAKDRYWTRLRAGYDFQRFIVGPEAQAIGNEEYDEQRVGAFLTIKNVGPTWISIAAGLSSKRPNRGGDSAYGTLEVSTTF